MTGRSTANKPPPLPQSPAPASPRTPLNLRHLSSSFASPSLTGSNSFRTDDEVLVYVINSRSLLAGFGGEASPRSCTHFGLELQVRHGNYERHLIPRVDYLKSKRRIPQSEEAGGVSEWGKDHTLYSPDLRGVDFGLLGDTLSRALRQAHIEDLLVMDDTRKRAVHLVVDSNMSQPLLEVILGQCFKVYPSPSMISVLGESVMACVAAGVRSGLIVNIGWEETTVTAVCEYREVKVERSERATRRLHWGFAQLLQNSLPEKEKDRGIAFEDAAEVVHRLAWCRVRGNTSATDTEQIKTITLPSLGSTAFLELPFSRFAEIVEAIFFTTDSPNAVISKPPETDTQLPTPPPTPPVDSHLQPLPLLLYDTLLQLPPDIRATLFSRIIFTGEPSNIPGLKPRTLIDLATLIRTRGWNKVSSYGSATSQWQGIEVEIEGLDPPTSHTRPPRSQERTTPPRSSSNSPARAESVSPMPPHPTVPKIMLYTPEDPLDEIPPRHREPEPDSILAKIKRTDASAITQHSPREKITLRAIHSLGPWHGASLLAGLRVRAAVEIDRDMFLAQGLAGIEAAKRRSELHATLPAVNTGTERRNASPEKRASLARPGSPEKRTVSGRTGSPEKRTVSGRTSSPEKRAVSGRSPEKRSLGGRQSLVGLPGAGGGGSGLGIWG